MGHEEETISHSREKVTDREGVVAERQCAAGFSFRRREEGDEHRLKCSQEGSSRD